MSCIPNDGGGGAGIRLNSMANVQTGHQCPPQVGRREENFCDAVVEFKPDPCPLLKFMEMLSNQLQRSVIWKR
jgi:hypothetical protein